MKPIYILLLLIIVTPLNFNGVTLSSPDDFEKKFAFSDYQIAMWLLKKHESLTYKSYWDYKQYTIGWGTRSFKNEVIDYATSNERTKEEFQKRYNRLAKRYPQIEHSDLLILTVFAYNVGIGHNLDKAIKSGDKQAIAANMKKYVYAGGKQLNGLVRRRADETKMLLASDEERQQFADELRIDVIKHIKKAKSHD